MIYHKKTPTMPAIKRKEESFSDFSSPASAREKTGALRWKKCLNFIFSEGAVSGKIGAAAVCGNNPMNNYNIRALYFYSSDEKSELLFLTGAGLYRVALPVGQSSVCEPLLSKAFSAPPQGVSFTSPEGECRLLLYGAGGLYLYDGKNLKNFPDVPLAKGACLYNDRLFLASAETAGRVYFSSPLDETDFAPDYGGAGYIDLEPAEGEIRGVFAGTDGVSVLRDGRITILKGKGKNEDFSLTHTLFAGGKIYENSVQAAGAELLFLCSDGLRAFADGEISVIEPELTGNLPVESEVCSGVWNAIYFVCFTDKNGEGRVLFADRGKGEIFFGNMSVSMPVNGKGECYFWQNGTLCAFATDGAGEGIYESAPTDFGLGAARKILRAVEIEGEGDFVLTVRSEGGKRACKLSAINGSARACLALKGVLFTFSIECCSEECKLKKLTVKVDLPSGGMG